MFYCLESVQLIDYQLVALFIILKCTGKYLEMYGLISENIRIIIEEYTDKYLKMYALLSLNVRIIILEYTGVFSLKSYLNYREIYGRFLDSKYPNYRKMYG